MTSVPLRDHRSRRHGTQLRGRLLTLGAGLFAAGALVFTALNFGLLRRTYELTEQGQVTDRYTKAVEQLGSDKLDVRVGGIYALERVARDSEKDHPTIMEVLVTFIREHSPEQWPVPKSEDVPLPERMTRPDVQAALTVIGRRDTGRDNRPIDLQRREPNPREPGRSKPGQSKPQRHDFHRRGPYRRTRQ